MCVQNFFHVGKVAPCAPVALNLLEIAAGYFAIASSEMG
jgi:hypothetical protein